MKKRAFVEKTHTIGWRVRYRRLHLYVLCATKSLVSHALSNAPSDIGQPLDGLVKSGTGRALSVKQKVLLVLDEALNIWVDLWVCGGNEALINRGKT